MIFWRQVEQLLHLEDAILLLVMPPRPVGVCPCCFERDAAQHRGKVQVLLCVLLSSEIDSVQLVWLCSLCGNRFVYGLAGACMLPVVAAVSGACVGFEVCGGSE